MRDFGKLILELDRDGATMRIYDDGVVVAGREVETEFGFDGFWGKIAKKALSEFNSKAASSAMGRLSAEERSSRAKRAVAARIAKYGQKSA